MSDIDFPTSVSSSLRGVETLFLLASKKALTGGWHRKALPASIARRADPLVDEVLSGEGPTASSLSPEKGGPRRIIVHAMSDTVSRHNTPTRKEEVFTASKAMGIKKGGLVVTALDSPHHLAAVLNGLGRGLPLFDRGTSKKGRAGKGRPAARKPRVAVVATLVSGKVVRVESRTRELARAVREAARLVDTPAADLSTSAFVTEARKLVRGVPRVTVTVIAGRDLVKKKLLGIHAVGGAARVGPRLLVLDYRPEGKSQTVCLVGKGVVYDTGGLSLKPTSGMCTMKADMAGAAAVVGAFRVLAKTGCRHRVVALAPLAENSIGSSSYRPDDILTLHSGHTVEINNTDAEGRLLLADAVSLAARSYSPLAIIDAATLTGAQLIATGERHAAVISNRQELETIAIEAGRLSGDLVFPLPFCPEFYQSEFESQVADMKNSVKSRMNAQSSCAAQFVYSHIDDIDVPWLHIDLAGPAFRGERATGYGVALLTAIVDALPRVLEH